MGKKHHFEVAECVFTQKEATCVVIKDAGDDPDCTDGAHLTATISWNDAPGEVNLIGGEGVARVNKPGLGLEVGSAAINPVPTKNIIAMVREGAEDRLKKSGLRVVISVPEGIAMAKKTLNHRLGLMGGISILGTSGIVRPYSSSAYKVSILQGIDVAAAAGCETVVFTTGGKSEAFLMDLTRLDSAAYIQMGDFVGYSLKRALKKGIKNVIIGGMPGKMSKIAMGKMQTHAAGSQVDLSLLANIAKEAGATAKIVAEISSANTARHVQELVQLYQVRGFWDIVARKVCEVSRKHVANALALECILVDFGGAVIGRSQIGSLETGKERV